MGEIMSTPEELNAAIEICKKAGYHVIRMERVYTVGVQMSVNYRDFIRHGDSQYFKGQIMAQLSHNLADQIYRSRAVKLERMPDSEKPPMEPDRAHYKATFTLLDQERDDDPLLWMIRDEQRREPMRMENDPSVRIPT